MLATIHLSGQAHSGGPVRRLHGVNNGPIAYGGLIDVSSAYRRVGIPHVRLHDANYPHAWEVDVHTIFPDMGSDEGDPSNYDFARTDDYVASVVDTGASIVFRLGESIEHAKNKYFVHAPSDAAKWARVCAAIVRHYNHGWANGFEYGIKYWEIWNEPDLPGSTWIGDPDYYFVLYETAARLLKAEFPEIGVGGPAATMTNHAHTREFLRVCRDRSIPLDFVSWHLYTQSVSEIVKNAEKIQSWMTEFGHHSAESHLNEWNYADLGTPFLQWGPEKLRSHFEALKGRPGAVFVAGVLCALQDTTVRVANYYDGQPKEWFCGLFDDYGTPLPPFAVIEHFSRLCKRPERLALEVAAAQGSELSGFHSLAAGSADEVELWLVNETEETTEVVLTTGHRFSRAEAETVAPAGQASGLSTDPSGRDWRLCVGPSSVQIVRLTR